MPSKKEPKKKAKPGYEDPKYFKSKKRTRGEFLGEEEEPIESDSDE